MSTCISTLGSCNMVTTSAPWPRSLPCALFLLITSSLAGMVHSDLAKDKAECATTLMEMATCLPYVQGKAKAPTPDCCDGLNTVHIKNRKCLCLLIEDRNEAGLGITFNASLALSLPTACHNSAVNITECPSLLNLPPGSKDADIFLQYVKDHGNSTGTAGGAKSSNATSAAATKSPDTSGVGGKKLMRWSPSGVVNMASGASSLLLIAFLFLTA